MVDVPTGPAECRFFAESAFEINLCLLSHRRARRRPQRPPIVCIILNNVVAIRVSLRLALILILDDLLL